MKPSRRPARVATPRRPEEVGGTFARAITRAEFGRFYWSDELADEVKRACLKNQKPPKRN